MVGSEVDVGRPDSYVVWEDLDYVSRRSGPRAPLAFSLGQRSPSIAQGYGVSFAVSQCRHRAPVSLGSEVAIDRSGLRRLLRRFAVSTSSAGLR